MSGRSKDGEFDGRAIARDLVQAPGVYLMRDAEGRPLYVGKARNLRKRVSSYFDRRDKGARIGLMVSKIRSIEVSILPWIRVTKSRELSPSSRSR